MSKKIHRRPESPMLKALRKHLASLSPAEFRAEWQEIEALGLQGPTVKEFIDDHTSYAALRNILFGLSRELHSDFNEMYADICSGLGFNPYERDKLLSLPAAFVEGNSAQILARAYEAASQMGGDTYVDIYKPMAMQLVGFIHLRAGVEMDGAIRSQVRWGLDNDYFAERDPERRNVLAEVKKLIQQQYEP